MYYDAFDLINEPILIIDDEDKLVFANKEAISLFNLPEKYNLKSAESLLSRFKWLPEVVFNQSVTKKQLHQ